MDIKTTCGNNTGLGRYVKNADFIFSVNPFKGH
jgi:hypothetical protein